MGSCIFWFQPAVWLLKNAAFQDVEVACDQSVAADKSEVERDAYAKFLLDSLRRGRERNKAYSAYFYNSKAVMRARLQVVTREQEPGFVAGAGGFSASDGGARSLRRTSGRVGAPGCAGRGVSAGGRGESVPGL